MEEGGFWVEIGSGVPSLRSGEGKCLFGQENVSIIRLHISRGYWTEGVVTPGREESKKSFDYEIPKILEEVSSFLF